MRRQLEPQVTGAAVTYSWARLPRRTSPSVAEFQERLKGRTIVAAKRRGKQIYFPLDNGDNLLVHLGMTGHLTVRENPEPEFDPESLHKHIHAIIGLEGGRQIVFTDPRTFGRIGVARELDFVDTMGPEPLDEDFDVEALAKKLSQKNVKIKAAILDQRLVTGLGNIYADEVCFLAGVHPETRAKDIPLPTLVKLVGLMRPVLERAIAARGATLKDGGYQDTFGEYGEFIPQAYGRTGDPCDNCGTTIQRGTLGPGKSARSYHFCPNCQPAPEK